jgi:hypothetical protein
MLTASSAQRTCFELMSASECTATVLMPIFLQVEIIRHAISPLLAMRILSKYYRLVELTFHKPLHRPVRSGEKLHVVHECVGLL